MFDISSPKILTPAALFTVLTPGVLLQLPTTLKLMSGKTDVQSVFFHAFVFIIVYKIISMFTGLVLTKADLIVPAVLFVLLSPGFIIGKPTLLQTIIHMCVFVLVFAFLRKQFPQYY